MKKKAIAFTGLLLLVLLGILYFNFNPASNSNKISFPPCPTYSILGIHCPGCGTQRAIHYLLHLEITKAFRYNPLMIVFLPLIILLILKKILLFFNVYIEIKLFRKTWFTYTLFIIVIVYFILRNVPLSIFEWLRPPLIAL